MFSFGKKKTTPEPPPRPGRRNSEDRKENKSQTVQQLGFLVGVDNDADFEVDDADLEDELMMLLNGEDIPIRGRPKPASSPAKGRAPAIPPRPKTTKPQSTNLNTDVLNVNFDDEDEGDDVDSDADLDDPELMAELGELTGEPVAITPPTETAEELEEEPLPPASSKSNEEIGKILVERLDLYEKAKSIADSNGDTGKSRRFIRSIKTIKELLTKVRAGKTVDESEIPPPVSLGTVVPKPTSPPDLPVRPNSGNENLKVASPVVPDRPFTPEPDYNTELPAPLIPIPAYVSPKVVVPEVKPIQTLQNVVEMDSTQLNPSPKTIVIDPEADLRLKDYKRMAVGLKRSGDVQGALQYLKLSKTLESAIKNGEPVDLSSFPAIPSSEATAENPNDVVPTSDALIISNPANTTVPMQNSSNEEPSQPILPSEDIFGAPPPPKTIMEALEQRLEKFKSEVEKANSTSNASKARRVGRIVKQYEEAINLYKKGKPVAYDELPTPPGFAPIPLGGPSLPPAAIVPTGPPLPSVVEKSQEPANVPQSPSAVPSNSPGAATSGSPGSVSSIQRAGKPTTKYTHQEKQLAIIMLRQKQFKEAALNAKKRGDVDQAREFLRTAKGFDKLISVSQAGLPVDMATLPAPPEAVAALESDFEVISQEDCIEVSGSLADIFSKLEEDLKSQMKMCMRTRDHFKSSGDVGSANRFESLALESKRDLDTLRLAARKGQDIPKYHYETRIFSITECNTDINEDEIEISVLQGIQYKVANPSDVDTYVRVEMPYPSAEEAQSNKTHVVKDTNNPEYNVTYKMPINRTARNFQRFVHRHGIKFEVFSKGGFLRGSTLLGQATAKLLPLETKCTLHDAFEILDGRKVIGKLEVKIRIRDPVLTKQISQKKEKWLSIDKA